MSRAAHLSPGSPARTTRTCAPRFTTTSRSSASPTRSRPSALTWEVNPNQTVYATAAKGARLGSENRFIPTGVCGQDLQNQGLSNGVPDSYGPDSLWSYEVGSKSKLLGNRLTVNVAAFYIDW